ncbi:hypothetical protein R0131_06195 [Clostridium sp. AL.422]|uniref:hypothetical protein n=1 Tax=Clostridium TaxID=1485 RepID=UPI00293DE6E5|nr:MULTISPECIES: hypothetical protein [unclassified Clostridium]MDV4150421.1 hypothetical protein [Clostridium sp. AL.422]
MLKIVSKNILIVCSAGFATGRLLEAKIKGSFDDNIVGVTSIHNISRLLESKEKILILKWSKHR